MEEAFKAQLDAANTSLGKGHEAMKKLMARATKRYDAGKGILMPDWKILLE